MAEHITPDGVGSRYVDAWGQDLGGIFHRLWTECAHTKLETTAKYLNVTTQYLGELNERRPLTLIKG